MKQTVEEAAYNYLQKILESSDFEINFEEDNYDAGARDAVLDVTERAYIAGAEWRINSVWHSNNRTYKAQKPALVIFKNGKAKVYDNLTDLTIESLWGEIDRFAYIEDLIPNMED